MLQKTTTTDDALYETVQKDQAFARMMLGLIFRSLTYLRRKGIAIRGSDHRDSNLCHLMMKRTACLPKERQWLLPRDSWISDIIQNKIVLCLQMFAQEIQFNICEDVQRSAFFWNYS